ncbi:MAG TPA: hypothetical protein VHY91_23750 [Pirellulales bacterium]|jgi:hypothetical protein|nr:hypothetical protein [Pirellulales bacterium]
MGLRGNWIGMNLAVLALGMALLAATLALSVALGSDVGDLLTRNTVRLSLAWYAAAVGWMLFLEPEDWAAGTARGRLVRWCWTWGLVCFLVHLAMAFHYFHHWSHADAFARTRQVSGVGEGIYVSYLFTLLWAADVAYWWVDPQGYAGRPAWIARSLHTFMLFIVLNGTVVFESGPIRWAGLLGLALLAVAWWMARLGRRSRQAAAA